MRTTKEQPLLRNNGFTLIELLVVVLIIGILAAIALPQYQAAVFKSRVTTAIAGLKALKNGAEIYYLINGKYPPDNDIQLLDVEIKGCSSSGAWMSCSNGILYGYGISAGGNSGIPGWQLQSVRFQLFYSNNTLEYIMFLDKSPDNPGKIMCHAATNQPLARKFCQSMASSQIDDSKWWL
jgi:prepilin-type N-terminal cleavage/methylation domain-containing protein